MFELNANHPVLYFKNSMAVMFTLVLATLLLNRVLGEVWRKLRNKRVSMIDKNHLLTKNERESPATMKVRARYFAFLMLRSPLAISFHLSFSLSLLSVLKSTTSLYMYTEEYVITKAAAPKIAMDISKVPVISQSSRTPNVNCITFLGRLAMIELKNIFFIFMIPSLKGVFVIYI